MPYLQLTDISWDRRSSASGANFIQRDLPRNHFKKKDSVARTYLKSQPSGGGGKRIRNLSQPQRHREGLAALGNVRVAAPGSQG